MVNQEQVIEWKSHPVTKLYFKSIASKVKDALTITATSTEGATIQSLGEDTLARVNYAAGLEDSMRLDFIFGVSDEQN
jgi:hypothetical protein